MPAKRIAAMELGVPAAPTGTYKPIDAIAPSLLRASAASGRRGISHRISTSGFRTVLSCTKRHQGIRL
ncbi:hypothetical protein D3C84_778580 [compost metagenome]